jgi:hypothetical protein
MQEASFDATWLLRLRAFASAGGKADVIRVAGDVAAPIATAMKTARDGYRDLGLQPDAAPGHGAAQVADSRSVLAIFRALWRVLGCLPQKHPLHVLPIHDDEMLEQLLLALITAVRRRELDAERRHDTGHFIVGGVEDTGKTMLLKAVAVGVAACSTRFFLAYVDYKRLRTPDTPTQIAVELFARMRYDDFAPPFGMLRTWDTRAHPASQLAAELDSAISGGALVRGDTVTLSRLLGMLKARCGCRIGLIADGVLEMLQPTDEGGEPRLIQLMRDLEQYARHEVGALLVLSGSSANLRARLFENDREPRFRAYPNFNRTLCSYWHVSALRTSPPWSHTGGLGRLVHGMIDTPSAPLARVKDPKDA